MILIANLIMHVVVRSVIVVKDYSTYVSSSIYLRSVRAFLCSSRRKWDKYTLRRFRPGFKRKTYTHTHTVNLW